MSENWVSFLALWARASPLISWSLSFLVCNVEMIFTKCCHVHILSGRCKNHMVTVGAIS